MPVSLLTREDGGARFSVNLGWGDMVFCFFSNVSFHLEGTGKWGSRFPKLLLDLCDKGVVSYENIDKLDKELGTVYHELQELPLSSAIYDIYDLSSPIPWEQIPGIENGNLAQSWVTPRGEESYFKVFSEYIKMAKNYESFLALIFPRETAFRDSIGQPMKKGRDYWLRDKG